MTDKALLEGVLSGSFNNKDGRVKDDGFIYMVLEYGEIDLAHMLSQKWKELDGCNQTIDENWLRFYWQVSSLQFNLKVILSFSDMHVVELHFALSVQSLEDFLFKLSKRMRASLSFQLDMYVLGGLVCSSCFVFLLPV